MQILPGLFNQSSDDRGCKSFRGHMPTKYERAVAALSEGKDHTMKVFGQSMRPLIQSGSKLTFRKTDDYQKGDVVLSKVKGRWIDAHKIVKVDSKGRYLIANNHGYENGWTTQVFGRVIAVNGESFGRPSNEQAALEQVQD